MPRPSSREDRQTGLRTLVEPGYQRCEQTLRFVNQTILSRRKTSGASAGPQRCRSRAALPEHRPRHFEHRVLPRARPIARAALRRSAPPSQPCRLRCLAASSAQLFEFQTPRVRFHVRRLPTCCAIRSGQRLKRYEPAPPRPAAAGAKASLRHREPGAASRCTVRTRPPFRLRTRPRLTRAFLKVLEEGRQRHVVRNAAISLHRSRGGWARSHQPLDTAPPRWGRHRGEKGLLFQMLIHVARFHKVSIAGQYTFPPG